MNTSKLSGKRIWITGASSGIGLELALIAAEAGAHLHLFSSRRTPLADAARLCAAKGAASVLYDAVDLSLAEMALATGEKVMAENGVPHYLILNAGISQRSMAAETDFAVTRKIMELNFLAAAGMTRAVLPAMIENGGGHIGVTSSVTGVFGFPLRSAYAASKHALHGFFESVRLEYRLQGIDVTLAIPGRIRTDISLNSLEGDGRRHEKMDAGQQKGMDPQICARRYWRAVLRGREEVVIGGADTLMVTFHRYIPWLFNILARRVSPL